MTRLLPVPVLPVPAKQSYRVTNWPACNRSLVTRGQVTLWLHEEVQLGWRASGGKGIRASDAAILCALSLRAACKLPLRQAQGLLGSLMALLDPTAPVPLFAIGAAGGCTGGAGAGAGGAERPVASAIDLTGLKLFGEGEWSEADQKTGWGPVFPPNAPAWQGETPGSGASCIWQWTKEGVRSSPLSLTPSSRHDRPALPDLLAKVPGLLASVKEPVAVVSADKGCDSFACHRAIPAIGARPGIPPRTGAAITPPPKERDAPKTCGDAVRRIHEIGVKPWKVASGYHRRSRAETAMARYKTIIGPNLRSRNRNTRITEAAVAIRCSNTFTALGMPKAVKIA